MAAVDVLHLGGKHFAPDFCAYAPKSRCFALALSVQKAQGSAHAGGNVRVIELGLQLLYVSSFRRFQVLLCYGVLDGDGKEAMVIVVLGPPSDCQLCVHNFVLLYLLVFAVAAGFPAPQIVLAASNVLKFGLWQIDFSNSYFLSSYNSSSSIEHKVTNHICIIDSIN